MNLYLDTGALVKLYVIEPGSEAVQELARDAGRLFLTPFQLLELRNALRAAHGRGLIDRPTLSRVMDNLREDIDCGSFDSVSPDWPEILASAEDLSEAHTAVVLCRTLDILHVATAVGEGATGFATGDKRQAELARKAGLHVFFIHPD